VKPGSFERETSRGMVGHERAEQIEAKARADAQAGNYAPPPFEPEGASYWACRQAEFARCVYDFQYGSTTRKLERA
jgi:hypothetical protein